MNASGGFERGGWQRPPGPRFDDKAAAFLAEVYQRADAFLFGRWTHELLAGYWGVRSGNPIADALNARPKCVALGVTIQVYRPTGRPRYAT